MSAKNPRRPKGLIGGYAPTAPATVTELYVALSRREDGREHFCMADFSPLMAGGGRALEWLRETVAHLEATTGERIEIVRFVREAER